MRGSHCTTCDHYMASGDDMHLAEHNKVLLQALENTSEHAVTMQKIYEKAETCGKTTAK